MTHEDIRWSTSAITFYKPERLGSPDLPSLVKAVSADPAKFWTNLLNDIAASGAAAVEFSIPPGDWYTAKIAFGSAEGVRRELDRRGLHVSSSYMTGHPIADAISNPGDHASLVNLVHDHAAFIAAVGGDLILQGPAKRTVTSEGPSPTIDDGYREGVASIVNDLAAAARQAGTRYAIHTEAYSVVARNEDIDQMLAATNPDLVLLCPDAGHITLDGGDAREVFRKHLDRIPIAHWKDCAAPVAGDTSTGHIRHGRMIDSFRRAGRGIVDWNGISDTLVESGFQGWAVAEIDFADEPVREVSEVLAFGQTRIEQARSRASV